jgi:antagonist of KipI
MGKALETVRIDKPGLLTTVQDLGRPGLLHLALSRAGAMDRDQLAIANLLVGNDAADAGLEFTGMGPTIFFPQESCIATTGAWCPAVLTKQTGESCTVSPGRPIIVPAGSTIRWGTPVAGFRIWLAVAGGIDVPQILGSRASHLAAEVGLLRIGQPMNLSMGKDSARRMQTIKQMLMDQRESSGRMAHAPKADGIYFPAWAVPSSVPRSWPVIELLAIPGRHFDLLSASDQKLLLSHAWQVSPRSNRQGLGLEGAALDTAGHPNLDSEPVRQGTVQLPPAGKPFVLLVEHQSTGGYPRILEVISAMAPELAQAGPTARVVFKLVDLARADALRQQRQRDSAQLQQIVQSRLVGS